MVRGNLTNMPTLTEEEKEEIEVLILRSTHDPYWTVEKSLPVVYEVIDDIIEKKLKEKREFYIAIDTIYPENICVIEGKKIRLARADDVRDNPNK